LTREALPAAFEAACLLLCTSTQEGGQPPGIVAEFNSAVAAGRLAHLLDRLGVPTVSQSLTGGLRRRHELFRLHTAEPAILSVLVSGGWRQGRGILLDPSPAGATAPRQALRVPLAVAAWRAALLAAGRHVQTHILGVRLRDAELAAVLVRSAHLLDAAATVAPRPGCLLVTIPAGPGKDRIMRLGTDVFCRWQASRVAAGGSSPATTHVPTSQ
jgi:hypothetical protein